jgi:hypothetical protein
MLVPLLFVALVNLRFVTALREVEIIAKKPINSDPHHYGLLKHRLRICALKDWSIRLVDALVHSPT